MFISIFFLASEVRIVNERKYDQTGDDEEPSTRQEGQRKQHEAEVAVRVDLGSVLVLPCSQVWQNHYHASDKDEDFHGDYCRAQAGHGLEHPLFNWVTVAIAISVESSDKELEH